MFVTFALLREHAEEFSEDFDTNKVVEQYADLPSKKLRNIIADYNTRESKAKAE
ncbi:30S ribosomal protein S17e [Candidatus Woesearchaeota archaeon]|nr:30S ribosomal protein S17e [Candidatus Woesearchaeota archaeon]